MEKVKEKASYLRTESKRNRGNTCVVRFLKITDLGIIAVDTLRDKIYEIKTIGSSPLTIYPATEEEYEEARDKVINTLIKIIDEHGKG